MLNGSADDLSNSLNVVDVGDGKTNREIGFTLGGLDEVVQGLNEGESSNGYLGVNVGRPSLVPGALLRLLNKVVSVESRVRDEGNLLGLESNQGEHLCELILDFVETILRPPAGVHLVDTNNKLINTKKVKKTGMLTGLSLLNTHLGIGLGDGSLETSFLSGHKKKTNISGGRPGDHVLNVILVAGGIDNGIVVLFSEELLGVALNGNTTFTLLLTSIEVVSETKRRFTLLFGNSLKLFHLTRGDASLLKDEVTTCGGLSGIDVSADDN